MNLSETRIIETHSGIAVFGKKECRCVVRTPHKLLVVL